MHSDAIAQMDSSRNVQKNLWSSSQNVHSYKLPLCTGKDIIPKSKHQHC
jgi:hypothetical protein